MLNNSLCAVEDTLKIYIYHSIPILFLHSQDKGIPCDTRIVNHDMNRPEFCNCLICHGLCLLKVCNICPECKRPSAEPFCLPCCFLCLVKVHINNNHICAVGSKFQGYGPSYALRSACNKGNLIFENHKNLPLRITNYK